MAQNQELRLVTGVSTPLAGVAKLWVNNSGVVNVTSSAGEMTTVGGGVKEYVALISQSSTNNPTQVILQNTLGVTPVWIRTAIGTYRMLATGFLPINKIVPFSINHYNSTNVFLSNKEEMVDDESLMFNQYSRTGVNLVDNVDQSLVHVKVYP